MPKLFTAFFRLVHLKKYLFFSTNGNWIKASKKPPRKIPKDKARAGFAVNGLKSHAHAIVTMFNTMGAKPDGKKT
ncbi:hypothetical protein FACS1894190_02980 [Spirochaetia bacterium]|nr:hypothetical protein FACS1894190_02980 [Spirochaetia bacterium]